MLFAHRYFSLLAGCIFFFTSCISEKQNQDFTFLQHNIKFHYDPESLDLTAIDTMSIHYEKNVDRIYFFLHKSLFLERAGIGHQDFQIGEMLPAELANISKKLNDEWHDIIENSQVIVVLLPTSLYSEKIEIRYKGTIDLMQEKPVAWHPVLPGVFSTFTVTALIPQSYKIIAKGDVLRDEINEPWRLNRWLLNQPHACCEIRLAPQTDQ